MKIAMDYEGDHHRVDRRRYNHDIRKAETVAEMGWVDHPRDGRGLRGWDRAQALGRGASPNVRLLRNFG